MAETVKTLRDDYTSRLSVLEVRDVVNLVLLPFLSDPTKYHHKFFNLLSIAKTQYTIDAISTGTKIRAKSIVQKRCFIAFYEVFGELYFRFENPTRHGRKTFVVRVKETIRNVSKDLSPPLPFSEILVIAKKDDAVLFLPDESLSNLEAFCLKNI